MTLYEYLELTDGDEITVLDKDYDIEVYFYFNDPSDANTDRWDRAMMDFAKVLKVSNISGNILTVNMLDVIDDKIDALNEAKLFDDCDATDVMDSIENIIAGNVSENWFVRFVDVLREREE